MFDVYFALRAFLIMKFYSAPHLHAQKVSKIQKQVKAWYDSGKKTKLCTARGGWQSISPQMRKYKNKSTRININLYDILDLDEEKMTVKAEPGVNMGQISHYLISKGFTLPVLPEMDDLTVGGMIMGVGIETSSHKYGLFNDRVNLLEMEIILSNGDLVVCSENENRDLYDAIPWSYGTLGFLASATLRIIPCKPYVKLGYIPCHKLSDGVATFRRLCEDEDNPPDFCEALAYSKDTMVVMPGWFVDDEEMQKDKNSSHLYNPIGRWYKEWFFKHVEGFLSSKGDENQYEYEYLPLRDYYHRHTKSIFWELEMIIPFANHPIVRYLLGWALPPKVSFLKLTQTEAIIDMYEKQHVIQDMLVPMKKMKDSLEVFHNSYQIYPLWICPYRAYDNGSKGVPHRNFLKIPKDLSANRNEDDGSKYEMYVDLGAYGVPAAVKEKRPFDIVSVSRSVEQYIAGIHGFQMLYADSYLSYDEFREMFDHTHYDEMKAKFDPRGGFPEVYDKVCKGAKKYWEKMKDV